MSNWKERFLTFINRSTILEAGSDSPNAIIVTAHDDLLYKEKK